MGKSGHGIILGVAAIASAGVLAAIAETSVVCGGYRAVAVAESVEGAEEVKLVATVLMFVSLLRIVGSLRLIAVLICITGLFETILHSTMFSIGFIFQRFDSGIIIITNATVFIPDRITMRVGRLPCFKFTIHTFPSAYTLIPS